MKIRIEDKRKYLTADDGKLIYSALSPIEEQVGVCNVCVPIEWDEKELYIENEIPEEIDIPEEEII